ncbi:MAG TPA: hypothetical protein VFG62_21655, partial [Rhodopila sp.]|nr:hypothetical protein [Rhodopila sp.]
MTARRAWHSSVSAMFRSVRLEAMVVAVLITALLGTWAVSKAVERQVQASGIEAKRADSHGLARLLAQQWRQSLQQIAYLQDLAGLSIETAFPASSGQTVPPDSIRKALIRIGDGIQQVSARDASGHLLWSATVDGPGDIGEHVLPEASEAASERSDPLGVRPVTGRGGQRAIAFTAEHDNLQGTLLGTSTVLVNADLAIVLAEKTNLLRHGIVILMQPDGVVLAYSLNGADAARRNVDTTPLRAALERGQFDLIVHDSSGGAARFYSLAPVADTDILVAVGLSELDAMAPVNAAIDQVRRWALALCLALVAMAFVVNIV